MPFCTVLLINFSLTNIRLEHKIYDIFNYGDVWVGADAPYNCSNWTAAGGDDGSVGNSIYKDSKWYKSSSVLCKETAKLYCVKQ